MHAINLSLNVRYCYALLCSRHGNQKMCYDVKTNDTVPGKCSLSTVDILCLTSYQQLRS